LDGQSALQALGEVLRDAAGGTIGQLAVDEGSDNLLREVSLRHDQAGLHSSGRRSMVRSGLPEVHDVVLDRHHPSSRRCPACPSPGVSLACVLITCHRRLPSI
jgi:hypothetical protein